MPVGFKSAPLHVMSPRSMTKRERASDADVAAGPASKVPKAVQMARQKLGLSDKGGDDVELSADAIRAALTPKELNLLQTVARKALNEDQKQAWGKLNKNDKFMVLSRYIIDHDEGIQEGINRTSVFTERRKDVAEEWLMQSQIADDVGDAGIAKTLCLSGDLASRPHEYPSLAAEGERFFLFCFLFFLISFTKH